MFTRKEHELREYLLQLFFEWLAYVSGILEIVSRQGAVFSNLRIMAKRSKSYLESLHKSLKDPAEAAAYLNAAIRDVGDSGIEVLLLALRDVAVANGVSAVARKADLGRQSLYKTLSKNGNPQVSTLLSLLQAMKLRCVIQPAGRRVG